MIYGSQQCVNGKCGSSNGGINLNNRGSGVGCNDNCSNRGGIKLHLRVPIVGNFATLDFHEKLVQ